MHESIDMNLLPMWPYQSLPDRDTHTHMNALTDCSFFPFQMLASFYLYSKKMFDLLLHCKNIYIYI